MNGVTSDAKRIRFGFNYLKPETLIDSFESLLKQQDHKNAFEIAKNLSKFARANDALVRYYQILCLEALSDVARARNDALALAMLVEGVSESEIPELDERGAVRIPKGFFARFPDALAFYQEYRRYISDSNSRFEPKFSLGTGGLHKRVYFGEEHGRFDYWPPSFGKRTGLNNELHGLERDSVAALLIDDVVRRTLPPSFTKRSRSHSTVVTFGSCFAVNLARSLEAQNIRTQSFRIGEPINTTRANRLLLEYIFLESGPETEFISKIMPAKKCEEVREVIQNASLIVLTVGVSPVTEWKGTGKLCLSGSHRQLFEQGEVIQRFTTVEENRDNIISIVELIKKRNPVADVFVTLSPVPLTGVADGSSVVMRDVISKSTLRVAIEEAAKQCEFIYWPSFEVVKWIAPHVENALNYQAYAEDDKNSRHVSKWLIDIITSKFIEYIFEPEGQTSS